MPPEIRSSFLPTFQCLFQDFLTHPHTLSMLLASLSSSPDSIIFQRFPQLLVRFSLAPHCFPPILSELLRIHITPLPPSEPQLLFREDSIAVRTIREYFSQLFDPVLLPALKKCFRQLAEKKISDAKIPKKAFALLSALYTLEMPEELRLCCQIIVNVTSERFHSSSRHALTSLFFLRYLCPLILNEGTRQAANSQTYLSNAVRVVKMIQSLANGTLGPSEAPLDSASANSLSSVQSFSEYQQHEMTAFLDRLIESAGSTSSSDQLSLSTPPPYSDIEISEFASLLHCIGFPLLIRLRNPHDSHPPFSSLVISTWTRIWIYASSSLKNLYSSISYPRPFTL